MTPFTWALLVLCVVGLLAVVVSVPQAIVQVKRVQRRLDDIGRSRFVVSIQGLQFEGERLRAVSERAAPLTDRAQAAIAGARRSVTQLRMPDATQALRRAAADLRDLGRDLR